MEMIFDRNGWSSAEGVAGELPGLTHPEWHGLLARFHAERQASRAFVAGRIGGAVRDRGSFDRTTADCLQLLRQVEADVNLKDSANRKPAGDIEGASPAEAAPVTEGRK